MMGDHGIVIITLKGSESLDEVSKLLGDLPGTPRILEIQPEADLAPEALEAVSRTAAGLGAKLRFQATRHVD